MRRISLAVLCVLALALVPSAVAAPPAEESWAATQIEAVVEAGLMAPSVAEFRPDDVLTRGELAELVAAFEGVAPAPGDPARAATLGELDATLVRLLGLGDAAKQLRAALVSAGLEPGKRAGTEAVARMLGLRTNLPQVLDSAELAPTDPVNRAETAYSVARMLALRSDDNAWEIDAAKRRVASFTLPELTEWQRRILTTAVSFIGYPYVWAGTSEADQAPLGKPTSGGFDCSGFVWRVYKVEPYEDAPQLAGVLRGRTTYVMSAEVDPGQRIPLEGLQPADVVFFGDRGPKSKPAEVGHMGISLGNGWFIHSSSSRGVLISPLEDWYLDRFAWARRPLAEAGLS